MSALLVVDIGNTTTRVGVWRDQAVTDVQVIPTGDARQATQLSDQLDVRPHEVELALCSVVPLAASAWEEWYKPAGRKPFVLRGDTPTPLANRYRRPDKLGGDRLAAAVGAVRRFGAPVIVVSLGTATVVDAVSHDREYLGGAIAVGVHTGLAALAEKTTALPRIRPTETSGPIGADTDECLRVGATHGIAALVEGLARRMGEVVGADAPLAVTGGDAEMISPCLSVKHKVAPTLTLEGVAAAWEHNRRAR